MNLHLRAHDHRLYAALFLYPNVSYGNTCRKRHSYLITP